MEERILMSMRQMAWERAKGELRSMLYTYWDSSNEGMERFKKIQKHVEDFIEKSEDDGVFE